MKTAATGSVKRKSLLGDRKASLSRRTVSSSGFETQAHIPGSQSRPEKTLRANILSAAIMPGDEPGLPL
jgi:hypothetical protein